MRKNMVRLLSVFFLLTWLCIPQTAQASSKDDARKKVSMATLIGDVNGDGVISISDVTVLVDIILEGGDNPVADVNNDGLVSVADVTLLVDIILNGYNAFTIETNVGIGYGGGGVGPARGNSSIWDAV